MFFIDKEPKFTNLNRLFIMFLYRKINVKTVAKVLGMNHTAALFSRIGDGDF